eukprot:1143539-Pelagomonas_calceolata.AAC.1
MLTATCSWEGSGPASRMSKCFQSPVRGTEDADMRVMLWPCWEHSNHRPQAQTHQSPSQSAPDYLTGAWRLQTWPCCSGAESIQIQGLRQSAPDYLAGAWRPQTWTCCSGAESI